VLLYSLKLLTNAPKSSHMMCAMHRKWFLNAGHLIREASRVESGIQVIERLEDVKSVVISSKRQSASSKQ
jgi:hypothetical protein